MVFWHCLAEIYFGQGIGGGEIYKKKYYRKALHCTLAIILSKSCACLEFQALYKYFQLDLKDKTRNNKWGDFVKNRQPETCLVSYQQSLLEMLEGFS